MNSYKDYLISIGLSSGQHERYYITMNNQVTAFESWLKKRGLQVDTAAYKDLMDYVGYLQNSGKSVYSINRFLRSIGHYYDYKGLSNIALTTRIRGVPKTQPQGLLSEEELDNLYQQYEPKPHKNQYHHTDKLLLGMMIYQGLNMSEFMKIALNDLKLEKGIIYVGSGRQQRERYIPLQANQVLSLHTFILQVRPKLLKTESEKLFAPQAEDYHLLHWQFKQLSRKVKAQAKEKLDIQINKLNQLRQSRIAIWVKEEGLRKAQYLAGFRKVSSAERYQKASLEDLKKQVQLHHPLG